MSFKMINGFSVFSNNYLKQINSFINESIPLPEKPSLPFNDDYVNSLKSYESQTQAYFISLCDCIYYYLSNDDSNFNGRIKDAYYKIRNDYKEFQSYLRKAKREYNESRQIEKYTSLDDRDGSMSPSNPFYNIDDDGSNVYSIIIDSSDGDIFLEDYGDNTYVNKQLKKLKKLSNMIKKRNKKKLTKNQRKKLKRKTKLDSQNKSDNIITEDIQCIEMIESDDPQLMIQDFFKRYSQTGEWSWLMWNNYMTKIQQTNPVWFDIFNRYSYEMGINWNAMFTNEVAAQNASNVRLEVPNTYIYCYQQYQHNDFNQDSDQGKSVIFTPDVKQSIDDVNTNELFCDACKHEFKSKRAFHIHLRGIKHIQNEINLVKDQKPELFITEIEKENSAVLLDMTKEEKHLKWLLYNNDNSKVPGNYSCTICEVTCTSHKDLHTHLNGLKHHSNAGPDCIDTSVVVTTEICDKKDSDTKRPLKKLTSRIQLILNTCTNPLIGLNYVIEYQRHDQLLECKYVCDLCKVKFERKSFIQHIVSQKHRETYIKYIHPDLYDILRRDLSSKSVKLKRLEVFAEEVENFEGRKKLNIMLEKAVCNEDKMDSITYMHRLPVDIDEMVNDIQIDSAELVNENRSPYIETVSETNDKEDGEVESSDDENCSMNSKINSIIDTRISTEKSFSNEELEAGEIESNWSDTETVNISEKESEDFVEVMDNKKSQTLDLSEFDNYELYYNSEHLPLDGSFVPRMPRRLEFIQQRDRKQFRLKEVTTDIIEHFRQEAIWALNGSHTNNSNPHIRGRNFKHNLSNSQRDLPGALLLPPMSQPVGPIYTGSSSYYSKKKNCTENCVPCPESNDSTEMEYKNIIGSVMGLRMNNGEYVDRVNDPGLLQQVQHMLVNKESVDSRLNEVIREQLLDNSDSSRRSKNIEDGKVARRYLLSDPVNVDAINETLEKLQQLTNQSTETIVTNTNTEDGIPITSTANNTTNRVSDTCSRIMTSMGDRMTKRADFLGLNQPPPPTSFPKYHHQQLLEQTNADNCEFFIYPNNASVMYPFVSPGMIEHHKSFAFWKPPYDTYSSSLRYGGASNGVNNSLYGTQYHRPNMVTQSTVVLSDIGLGTFTNPNT